MTASYLQLLEHSYAYAIEHDDDPPESRLQFLGDHIFDFTTYDGQITEELALAACRVADAITNRTTFEFIVDPDQYRLFITMCNMPFFANRIEWGGSIRGAWWATPIKLQSCGLYEGHTQLCSEMTFTGDLWEEFMRAVVAFGATDPASD